MLSRLYRKNLPSLVGLLFACLVPLYGQAPSDSLKRIPDSVTVDAAELAERIIQEARLHLGKPYRYAANGPDRFDCSGLTRFVFNRFGYSLSRSTSAQTKDGRAVTGPLSELQKGDLIIFGGRASRRIPGHVGIFIELDSTGTDFSFIHAARTGVRISQLSETYYKQRFLGVRRILPDFAEAVPVDSSALVSMSELADRKVHIKSDTTLVLSPSDRHVILFADGTWGLVDSLGILTRPEAQERLVLAESGAWRSLPLSSIRIPELQASTAVPVPQSAAASRPAPLPDDGSAQYHTVVSGDTLSGIARKYQTSVQALCDLNGMTAGSILRVGKKLRVR